ncbi:MAG: FAD-dependent oxidoreductase [Lachnospiraceae bacterium]|jgi:thioredoxin reductase (NADPH)|nr:FAD-dependent oxidoreductase [Lachnospiraceae bacterium]
MENHMKLDRWDVIIIGAGPAGLSAAVYAKRAALTALVIEQNPISGGQILNTYEVDNYLGLPGSGGLEMAEAFRKHADDVGCTFTEAEVTAITSHSEDDNDKNNEKTTLFTVKTDMGDITTRTVIIAAGASYARLGVHGEELLAGMGVSYCAICDGAFFRKRIVAVVGGGDVAVEDAIFLARGCAKVYLIHRRDELRAAASLGEALLRLENVEVLWDTVVESINGEDCVESLTVKNLKSGESSPLAVNGVFIAVGFVPNSTPFRDFVACDEKGHIIAAEDCATSVPGIFAAGDIRTKGLRQIVTAVADGAVAVTGITTLLARQV